MELMFDLQSGDTSVSSAAANFGEVGGPGLVKSTHTTSTWCPLGPLVTSVAKSANGVCGALGSPGAGAGAVVERAAPVSLSDDREGRLVSSQATGSLSATGQQKKGRQSQTTKTMASTNKENTVTAPGALGTPGADMGVVVERATPTSLSDAREDPAVDHQAAGVLSITGEEKGDPPSEALPGPSGPAAPRAGKAPIVRLQRLTAGTEGSTSASARGQKEVHIS
ncbi:hypothetical protein WN55_07541 [Dufourea novaeangliae]|uniref:Uncharacterized protein n=1 Tax=Dufourea novaeangliae TaxID=178035 RepID=A0A154P6D8_DUFNO|nr:hypothetical protein WN55_07541 [Dufourea novaeangliae]